MVSKPFDGFFTILDAGLDGLQFLTIIFVCVCVCVFLAMSYVFLPRNKPFICSKTLHFCLIGLNLSDLTYRRVDRKIHDGGYVEERVRVITLSVITSL